MRISDKKISQTPSKPRTWELIDGKKKLLFTEVPVPEGPDCFYDSIEEERVEVHEILLNAKKDPEFREQVLIHASQTFATNKSEINHENLLKSNQLRELYFNVKRNSKADALQALILETIYEQYIDLLMEPEEWNKFLLEPDDLSKFFVIDNKGPIRKIVQVKNKLVLILTPDKEPEGDTPGKLRFYNIQAPKGYRQYAGIVIYYRNQDSGKMHFNRLIPMNPEEFNLKYNINTTLNADSEITRKKEQSQLESFISTMLSQKQLVKNYIDVINDDLNSGEANDANQSLKKGNATAFQYETLAKNAFRNNKLEDCVSYATRSIKINRLVTHVYFLRAIAYFELGKYHHALQDFKNTRYYLKKHIVNSKITAIVDETKDLYLYYLKYINEIEQTISLQNQLISDLQPQEIEPADPSLQEKCQQGIINLSKRLIKAGLYNASLAHCQRYFNAKLQGNSPSSKMQLELQGIQIIAMVKLNPKNAEALVEEFVKEHKSKLSNQTVMKLYLFLLEDAKTYSKTIAICEKYFEQYPQSSENCEIFIILIKALRVLNKNQKCLDLLKPYLSAHANQIPQNDREYLQSSYIQLLFKTEDYQTCYDYCQFLLSNNPSQAMFDLIEEHLLLYLSIQDDQMAREATEVKKANSQFPEIDEIIKLILNGHSDDAFQRFSKLIPTKKYSADEYAIIKIQLNDAFDSYDATKLSIVKAKFSTPFNNLYPSTDNTRDSFNTLIDFFAKRAAKKKPDKEEKNASNVAEVKKATSQFPEIDKIIQLLREDKPGEAFQYFSKFIPTKKYSADEYAIIKIQLNDAIDSYVSNERITKDRFNTLIDFFAKRSSKETPDKEQKRVLNGVPSHTSGTITSASSSALTEAKEAIRSQSITNAEPLLTLTLNCRVGKKSPAFLQPVIKLPTDYPLTKQQSKALELISSHIENTDFILALQSCHEPIAHLEKESISIQRDGLLLLFYLLRTTAYEALISGELKDFENYKKEDYFKDCEKAEQIVDRHQSQLHNSWTQITLLKRAVKEALIGNHMLAGNTARDILYNFPQTPKGIIQDYFLAYIPKKDGMRQIYTNNILYNPEEKQQRQNFGPISGVIRITKGVIEADFSFVNKSDLKQHDDILNPICRLLSQPPSPSIINKLVDYNKLLAEKIAEFQSIDKMTSLPQIDAAIYVMYLFYQGRIYQYIADFNRDTKNQAPEKIQFYRDNIKNLEMAKQVIEINKLAQGWQEIIDIILTLQYLNINEVAKAYNYFRPYNVPSLDPIIWFVQRDPKLDTHILWAKKKSYEPQKEAKQELKEGDKQDVKSDIPVERPKALSSSSLGLRTREASPKTLGENPSSHEPSKIEKPDIMDAKATRKFKTETSSASPKTLGENPSSHGPSKDEKSEILDAKAAREFKIEASSTSPKILEQNPSSQNLTEWLIPLSLDVPLTSKQSTFADAKSSEEMTIEKSDIQTETEAKIQPEISPEEQVLKIKENIKRLIRLSKPEVAAHVALKLRELVKNSFQELSKLSKEIRDEKAEKQVATKHRLSIDRMIGGYIELTSKLPRFKLSGSEILEIEKRLEIENNHLSDTSESLLISDLESETWLESKTSNIEINQSDALDNLIRLGFDIESRTHKEMFGVDLLSIIIAKAPKIVKGREQEIMYTLDSSLRDFTNRCERLFDIVFIELELMDSFDILLTEKIKCLLKLHIKLNIQIKSFYSRAFQLMATYLRHNQFDRFDKLIQENSDYFKQYQRDYFSHQYESKIDDYCLLIFNDLFDKFLKNTSPEEKPFKDLLKFIEIYTRFSIIFSTNRMPTDRFITVNAIKDRIDKSQSTFIEANVINTHMPKDFYNLLRFLNTKSDKHVFDDKSCSPYNYTLLQNISFANFSRQSVVLEPTDFDSTQYDPDFHKKAIEKADIFAKPISRNSLVKHFKADDMRQHIPDIELIFLFKLAALRLGISKTSFLTEIIKSLTGLSLDESFDPQLQLGNQFEYQLIDIHCKLKKPLTVSDLHRVERNLSHLKLKIDIVHNPHIHISIPYYQFFGKMIPTLDQVILKTQKNAISIINDTLPFFSRDLSNLIGSYLYQPYSDSFKLDLVSKNPGVYYQKQFAPIENKFYWGEATEEDAANIYYECIKYLHFLDIEYEQWPIEIRKNLRQQGIQPDSNLINKILVYLNRLFELGRNLHAEFLAEGSKSSLAAANLIGALRGLFTQDRASMFGGVTMIEPHPSITILSNRTDTLLTESGIDFIDRMRILKIDEKNMRDRKEGRKEGQDTSEKSKSSVSTLFKIKKPGQFSSQDDAKHSEHLEQVEQVEQFIEMDENDGGANLSTPEIH